MDLAIPERMSVDDHDYEPALGAALEIRLNGIERTGVTGYDIPGRTITRVATDERGQMIVEGDEVKTETLTGDVAVTVKPEAAEMVAHLCLARSAEGART